MFIEANDIRPPSLLYAHKVNVSILLGGAATTLLAHLAIPAATMLAITFLGVVDIGTDSSMPSIQEDHVIEARFVKLGEKRDPRKLPNRRVPRKSTAPDEKVVVSKNMNPDPPKKTEKEERPRNAQEDLLTRLGDRAQAFAEIAEKRDQEGDPEGVEWGTETEAREGDIYRGKLVAFFKRGWTVPSTMAEKNLPSMVAKVNVLITQDLLIGSFMMSSKSGNPLFDQSVIDHLNKLRQSQANVPKPPMEIAHQFLGQRITIRFRGSDLR